MSLIVADRVQETTNTTGTGAYTLGGAVAGFQTFASVASDTDTVYYSVTDNVDFEVGLGTYASGGGTIARTTVLSSSNSGSAVNWGIGTKNIFLTYPADKAVYVDGDDLVPVSVGIDLNTTVATKPAYKEGTLFYDKAFGALAFYNDESDVTLQIGQEDYIRVYNDTGSTIANGSPVYLSGESGATPTIELATASGTYAEAQAVGIATHDIEDSSTGYVTTRGLIADVDTSALTVGQPVHVSTTAGELQTASPTFPNFPTEVGICLISDGSTGCIYVNVSHESFETMRVTGNSHMGGNLTVSGDFTVDGTQFINNSTNFSLAAPFTYLNAGADLTVTHSGSGLDDVVMGGTFEGTASTTYYVRIDGTGTPDTFEWSKDNFATTEATDVDITGTAQALDNGITVTFNATTGHTLNDSWSATAVPIDVDTGLFTNRNTGASGVGYTHMGIFFDASAEKWVLLNEYGPEPEGTIDLGDASVEYGTLKGATWEGAVSGNATTATSLATGRTIGMTGDVVWTSASFDGSGNVTGTATIQPNSVALGTDTTGNYVGTGAVSGVGLSGSAASEGATFTVTSNATDANTVSTIVARDGSGDFAAGTITADLTGDVTGALTGNADTATTLATGRTISLTGDVAGTSGSFDGSGNVSIAATIQANSVALGTDTTGNYVQSVANGSYLTGGGGASEGTALTLGVDATSANTASKVVARDGSGNFSAGTVTAALSGNASTATTLQTARTINGVSFNGSANITVADSTKVPTSRTVSAGGGISGGGALSGNITISHADTSSQGSSNNSGRTYIQDVTLDTYGHVTGLATATETVTDTTYSAGTNLSLSGTTFNVSSNPSFTDVYVDDQIYSTGDTDTYMQFHASNQWRVVAGGTERLEVNGGTITANGTFNNTSDERLKDNIQPIDNALSDVCKLQGVSFDWKDTGESTYGFIAQQVEPILPELVATDEEDGIKSVNYVGLIGHLVEAIKEQQAQIDALTAKLNG